MHHSGKSRKKKAKSLSPNITGFTPAFVAAGHLENPTPITITGQNFGDVEGTVYFENPGFANMTPAPPIYLQYARINPQFVTWSNTQIIINQLPSAGYSDEDFEYAHNAIPGTGNIRIKTVDKLPAESGDIITISHAIRNHIAFPTGSLSNPEQQQYYEVHNHDFVNDAPNEFDFEFIYDPEFYSNKPAYNAFHRALDTWRKATGVRFTEVCGEVACQDATANQVAVYFVTETTNNNGCQPADALGINHVNFIICDNKAYAHNRRIAFNLSPCGSSSCSWDFDSPNSNNVDYNFESTALHELGHLLMLDHVADIQDLMYKSQNAGTNPYDNIIIPSIADLEGVTYALNRDAVGDPNCPDYPPLQRYSLDQVPDFPACSDLCPNPDPDIMPDFAAYYVSNCDDLETLDAIGLDAQVGQEIYLEILDIDPSSTYEWLIEGDWVIDWVPIPDDYSYFILHWTQPGEFIISLSVTDGWGNCSNNQYCITIHEDGDCQMPDLPLASITQPTDCATGMGAVQFADLSLDLGCYEFLLYKIIDSNYELICWSEAPNTWCNDLAVGSYYAFAHNLNTGCYSESHFDIETHSVAPQALSACGGGLGSVHLNISNPNDYTYAWSNGNTTPSLVNVAAGNYSVTVTAIGGCSASASAVLAADAAPCFVDLRMRDNWNDIGEEPNTSSYQDDNGDGWLAYGSDDDWEDIWASPDLWNCPSGNDCPAWEWSNPTAAAYNKIGFSVYNSHPSLASEPATLHLYYSLANTGEVWESDWVNNNYEAEGYTCTVGNQIGTVVIPAIPANGIHEGWYEWTPPNFINNTLDDYISADACGLITEIDPIDETAKYEVCLLARLESVNDPINGEQGNGTPIRDNVLNSNNIVTRNTFLIDPNIGGSPGEPGIIGHPSIILVLNNNDDVQHLDVLFDKISGGSTEALDNLVEISWVLSPDLWAKWESTGKQGEGIQEIGEREVKITDMETAKLLNLPFDPREFQPLAIKVTILTTSGKRETLSYLPDEFGFRITHRSSDGSPINKPSNCHFTLKDLPQLAQTAYLVSEQLVCSPNPFSSSMNVQFYLAQEEAVTLSLYDLQGRLVKTIQPNEVVAAGTHNFAVDSQNLPNGVYICSLITESRQLNEKVVLVR